MGYSDFIVLAGVTCQRNYHLSKIKVVPITFLIIRMHINAHVCDLIQFHVFCSTVTKIISD